MENIFLIGFMGCGKSSVARAMSRIHHLNIVEMDEEIVTREGRTIPLIFEEEGEAYFRQLETNLLREITKEHDKIVSCGGGAAMRRENVDLMKTCGSIVYLTAEPETILERVKDDHNRPLLQGKKDVESIKAFLEQRNPKYEAAADFMIKTDGRSVEEICNEIMTKISERRRKDV